MASVAPDITSFPSPNFTAADRQPGAVLGIVLHDVEGSAASGLATLTTPGGVSAHYLIGESGRIYQLVDPRHVAYHCAAHGRDATLNRNRPLWLPPYSGGPYSSTNQDTIGIELAGFAATGYTDAQYRSLGKLCAWLCVEWDLPPTLLPDAGAAARITTHGWLQTDRTDPGPRFDWELFRLELWAHIERPEDMQGIIDELNRQVGDLRAEVEGLHGQVQQVTAERDDYAGQNATRQEQIDALRTELGERQADVARLTAELAEALAAPPPPVPVVQRSVRRVTLEYTDSSVQTGLVKA